MESNASLVAGTSLIVGVGLIVLSTIGPSLADGEKEFVCYDDGELVERHIGIKDTRFMIRGSVWHIWYTDGQDTYYNQPEGESCQVEVVKAAP